MPLYLADTHECEGKKMKTLEIVGENYCGKWQKSRTACRGIVLNGENLLLSYAARTGEYMLPGGGVEGSETDRECCIREIAEESGVMTEPSECKLEIIEYYGDERFVNRYFLCRQIGSAQRCLTKAEEELGMEARWVPLSRMQAVFGAHQSYAGTNEERRGIYLREYTALTELGLWDEGSTMHE